MLTGTALRAALHKHATITLVRHDEDIDPTGHFSDPTDVTWIRDQLAKGNEWAWFSAEVRAEYLGLIGRDALGACSYESEADFRKSGGYFDEMVTSAIDDLAQQIERVVAALTALAQEGF